MFLAWYGAATRVWFQPPFLCNYEFRYPVREFRLTRMRITLANDSVSGSNLATNLAMCLDEEGYAGVGNVLTPPELARISTAIESVRKPGHPAAVSNSSGVFSLQNLADVVPKGP